MHNNKSSFKKSPAAPGWQEAMAFSYLMVLLSALAAIVFAVRENTAAFRMSVISLAVFIVFTVFSYYKFKENFNKKCKEYNFSPVDSGSLMNRLEGAGLLRRAGITKRTGNIIQAVFMNAEGKKAWLAKIVFSFAAPPKYDLTAEALILEAERPLPYVKICRTSPITLPDGLSKPSRPAEAVKINNKYTLFCAAENAVYYTALLERGLLRKLEDNRLSVEADGRFIMVYRVPRHNNLFSLAETPALQVADVFLPKDS